MKPVLLALTFLSEEHRAQMAEVFEVVYAPDAAQAATAIATRPRAWRSPLAIGLSPRRCSPPTLLRAGAGYETVVDQGRGIVVATGAAPTTTVWPTTPGAC
jgi:hypothetical protein